MTTAPALKLGVDVIERLLPQRRPLLLVDSVTRYAPGARPQLRAGRHVSANEEVFAGHLPGLHLWPGVYTIEGLAQSCQLLATLAALDEAAQQRGLPPDALRDGLMQLERAYRLRPGARPERAAALLLDEGAPVRPPVGLLASVDVRLLAPVFAGCRLDYDVTRTHVEGAAPAVIARFDVEAAVDGERVARGSLTVATGAALPPRP